MYIVYILRSEKDGKRYIGFTENVVRRLEEHLGGNIKSTKNRRPLILAKKFEFDTKKEALDREKFFKTGKGREWLKENGY